MAPAHPGGPGKRAIKWFWCGGLYLKLGLAQPGPLKDVAAIKCKLMLYDTSYSDCLYFSLSAVFAQNISV